MSTYYYCYVLCARTEIEQISYWFGSQNTQTTFQMNWWRDNFTFILKLVIYSIVCTPRKFVTKNTAIMQRPKHSEKYKEMLHLIWEVNIILYVFQMPKFYSNCSVLFSCYIWVHLWSSATSLSSFLLLYLSLPNSSSLSLILRHATEIHLPKCWLVR
jgi:hypothetical protein